MKFQNTMITASGRKVSIGEKGETPSSVTAHASRSNQK
jgi:hypothetical protein